MKRSPSVKQSARALRAAPPEKETSLAVAADLDRAPGVIPPGYNLHAMTYGRRRLMKSMGLKSLQVPANSSEEAVQAIVAQLSAMTPDEQEFEILAQAWLLSRPDEDLLPGGPVREAILNHAWLPLFDAWTLPMDETLLAHVAAQFRAQVERNSASGPAV